MPERTCPLFFSNCVGAGSLSAAGVVRVSVLDLLRQLQSMEVTGTDHPSERSAAMRAFFAFMNDKLERPTAVFRGSCTHDRARREPLALAEARMNPISENERVLIRALVSAFRPDDFPISADAIAARGVRFLEDLMESGSGGTSDVRLLLAGVSTPMQFIDLSNREAVRRRLTEMENAELFGPIVRGLARFAQRLATFLVYATLDASNRPPAGLGYEIFPDRPRGQTATIPPESFLPREIWIQPEDRVPDHVYDVLVVGSGSGGAVVARRLVEGHGLDVAVLEIGDYVPESWTQLPVTGARRPLPWDEVENLLRYFKKGGMQLTQGISMFVFQGECLGGSSVVNNAVCFRMPQAIRDRWANEFGIPWTGSRLDGAYDRIQQELGIDSADRLVEADSATGKPYLNPTGAKLRSGAPRASTSEPARSTSPTSRSAWDAATATSPAVISGSAPCCRRCFPRPGTALREDEGS